MGNKDKHKNTFFFTIMWSCIVTNFFLIKPTDALIFPNLLLSRNSTCFGQFLCPSSGIFHCTFGTGIYHVILMTAFKSCPGWNWFYSIAGGCLKAVIKLAWHTPVPNVQWKTPDDGQRNCPKHVKFLDKNKFGKISTSVGFIKKKFHTRFYDKCKLHNSLVWE